MTAKTWLAVLLILGAAEAHGASATTADCRALRGAFAQLGVTVAYRMRQFSSIDKDAPAEDSLEERVPPDRERHVDRRTGIELIVVAGQTHFRRLTEKVWRKSPGKPKTLPGLTGAPFADITQSARSCVTVSSAKSGAVVRFEIEPFAGTRYARRALIGPSGLPLKVEWDEELAAAGLTRHFSQVFEYEAIQVEEPTP